MTTHVLTGSLDGNLRVSGLLQITLALVAKKTLKML